MQDEESVTIHLGETPVASSRQHARELFYELGCMEEACELDEPRIEMHTVPTAFEMFLNDESQRLAGEVSKMVVEDDPYASLF